MNMDSLKDLLVHELKDLYSAENQILDALPKMADAAEHAELRQAFEEHRRQTEEHVRRLERIFEGLNEKPGGEKCKGMQGLIAEGEELLKKQDRGDVLDAGLIAAAQRVEHYEIAAYGAARTYARRLGLQEDAQLLQQTLDEEGNTDERLTQIAESRVNEDALQA